MSWYELAPTYHHIYNEIVSQEETESTLRGKSEENLLKGMIEVKETQREADGCVNTHTKKNCTL